MLWNAAPDTASPRPAQHRENDPREPYADQHAVYLRIDALRPVHRDLKQVRHDLAGAHRHAPDPHADDRRHNGQKDQYDISENMILFQTGHGLECRRRFRRRGEDQGHLFVRELKAIKFAVIILDLLFDVKVFE